VDLRGATYPVLAFRSQLAGSGYTARAEISFDKASWAPVYSASAADAPDVEIDLAAYSGTVVWLRWTWTPVSGSDSWLVDSIVVREQPPATATAVPTSEPPTETPLPPTATPIPPTATPVPPTATPIPPTATPVPPTVTPVPPTATPVPPTATPLPPPTDPPAEATEEPAP
jgi:hypothetical protein